MKLLLVLFLVSLPVQAQICGPDVQRASKTVKTKSPLETTHPSGMAMVYVFAVGTLTPTDRNVSVDREWIGVLRSNNYFVAAVQSGRRNFCGITGGGAFIGRNVVGPVSHLEMELEPGKSYYLQFDAYQSMLSRITSDDAAVLLPKSRRRIFWPKGTPQPKE